MLRDSSPLPERRVDTLREVSRLCVKLEYHRREDFPTGENIEFQKLIVRNCSSTLPDNGRSHGWERPPRTKPQRVLIFKTTEMMRTCSPRLT